MTIDRSSRSEFQRTIKPLMKFAFIIAPCSIIKAALFPKLGPPPIQCCFKGDTLSALTQHCTGGRGEGTVKLSKKPKCTITFDQDCR